LYDMGVGTFVIGFGTGVGANINALNKIARAGSDPKNGYDAFFTNNLQDLINTLQQIFLIIGGSYARSSPVVSTTRDKVYRGYFNLPG